MKLKVAMPSAFVGKNVGFVGTQRTWVDGLCIEFIPRAYQEISHIARNDGYVRPSKIARRWLDLGRQETVRFAIIEDGKLPIGSRPIPAIPD